MSFDTEVATTTQAALTAGTLTMGAANVTSGEFGANTGGGNYKALNLGIGSSATNVANGLTVYNTGSPPGAHTDNQIAIYSTDSSDNTATLCLFLEQAVEEIGTFTPSHKVKIKLNGVEYYLQLDAV